MDMGFSLKLKYSLTPLYALISDRFSLMKHYPNGKTLFIHWDGSNKTTIFEKWWFAQPNILTWVVLSTHLTLKWKLMLKLLFVFTIFMLDKKRALSIKLLYLSIQYILLKKNKKLSKILHNFRYFYGKHYWASQN